MKEKRFLSGIAIALICALALTLLAGSGLLYRTNNAFGDALYLKNTPANPEIVVIGMDQPAIEVLGPMPWSRFVMADIINELNSDPETAPAVIGIDVLYVGASDDAEADAALAEAVLNAGNVVAAAAATFGSELVIDEENAYMDSRAVLAWDEPFEEYGAAAANIGHINAMADKDGIIRHALLSIDGPSGTVYSFARTIYERYAEVNDLDICPLPETEDDFFYLPFTTVGGSYYDGVSVIDVLNGDVPADYYAGKIVLIGPYAAGMQDEYRTAIDHAAPMYGIEIQANQINAYFNGFFPEEVNTALQLAILFAVVFLTMLWMSRQKILWIVIGYVAECGAWIGICKLAYSNGYVLDAMYIPMSVTVALVISIASNYIRAAKEKRQISATFGRYVDPAIIKELMRSGTASDTLGGKLCDIAVLFVDIRGFTTMSEALTPPEVVAILNQYLTLTTKSVMDNHGTLDKFVGDCTMAFWNAPLPQEDPVYLACRAAMDMVEGSKALGEELEQRFGRSVSFGVGVNWGPAVVGNIGAPRRMDFTAIGDTVNTAARLEANAPAGKVLISRSVADALGSRAEVTSLGGTIRLKGKAEGFEILTLDALHPQYKED